MYEIRMTKTFRKDAERCRKRGYDMELLKTAIRLLEADGQLPAIYHPHKLSGQYVGTWEWTWTYGHKSACSLSTRVPCHPTWHNGPTLFY